MPCIFLSDKKQLIKEIVLIHYKIRIFKFFYHFSLVAQSGQTRGFPHLPNGKDERKTSSHRSSVDSAEQLDLSKINI